MKVKPNPKKAAKQLRRLQTKLTDLLDQVEDIVKKNASRNTYHSALSYWLAHARVALCKDHEYLADTTDTLTEVIEELEGRDEEAVFVVRDVRRAVKELRSARLSSTLAVLPVICRGHRIRVFGSAEDIEDAAYFLKENDHLRVKHA